MSADIMDLNAAEIAASFRRGDITARETVEAALARIAKRDGAYNAFTDVTAARALARADALDKARGGNAALGPLAGVPFAAKNLFDIAGLPTRAGSKINRDMPFATADATLVQKLEAAGAILIGGLNMGEYAYDFTGESIHDSPSRNPHDLGHMTGGSSGGSGAAVAGGLVPLALGSDTNGSIRVPSALCGLFGLKPTYGRLSRAGTFPFVAAFDHLGPLARSVEDLALAYDAMQGLDPADPAQAAQPVAPALPNLGEGMADLRIATLGGHFAKTGEPGAFEAVARIASALHARDTLDLTQADRARSAGFLITMVEGAALHLERLKTRSADFDPAVRDRLVAGAMLPGVWVAQAQKFRSWFRRQALALFQHHDILLAPATPCRAPRLGQTHMVLSGEEMLVRPNLGLFTQPISFIGLPVVTVPIWTKGEKLPLGVQVIAAPWAEAAALRVAHYLQGQGVCTAPVAPFNAAGVAA